jgi:hypothetical protein
MHLDALSSEWPEIASLGQLSSGWFEGEVNSDLSHNTV